MYVTYSESSLVEERLKNTVNTQPDVDVRDVFVLVFFAVFMFVFLASVFVEFLLKDT